MSRICTGHRRSVLSPESGEMADHFPHLGLDFAFLPILAQVANDLPVSVGKL